MLPLQLGTRTLWVHRSKRDPVWRTSKDQAATGAQAGLTPAPDEWVGIHLRASGLQAEHENRHLNGKQL